MGCVTGACTNQTTRNENRADFGVFVRFLFLSFLEFLDKFLGEMEERAGVREGGCYAALPPSSSTLQHNSTRTQTFNRDVWTGS